jgi:DNA-binding MltR family transcriptional regulator
MDDMFSPSVLRHFEIRAEIEAQSDRAAALVAAAYLEERLREAIRALFTDAVVQVKESGQTVESRLFEGTGPLATFSAKISIALALGLVGPESLRELHLIRKIRNEFAHNAEPLGFGDSPVSDWCRELHFPEWCLRAGQDTPPTAPRDRFLHSVQLLWNFLWTEMSKKQLIGTYRIQPAPTTLI